MPAIVLAILLALVTMPGTPAIVLEVLGAIVVFVVLVLLFGNIFRPLLIRIGWLKEE